MGLIKFLPKIAFLLCVGLATANDEIFKRFEGRALRVKRASEENALKIDIIGNDDVLVQGTLGLNFPSAVPLWTNEECPEHILCARWGDYAQINISEAATNGCFRMEWTSTAAREIEDCYDLESGVHWYGGGEMFTQIWPIETRPRQETAVVPADQMADNEGEFGGVAERYWFLSNGAAIVVDSDSPLFYSLDSTHSNKVCFKAKDQHPYTERSPLTLNYEWCTAPDVKQVHQLTYSSHFKKPSGIPDERMLIQPLWSTWAEYKTGVNQTLVLEYARKVISEGFVNSSHIEIDDHWETCYGEEAFNPEKFPNAKAMVDEIKEMNLRVTAWVHPFVNYDCSLFQEGLENWWFVKNPRGRPGITRWWQGSNTGLIDMTNPDAVKWWTDRLRKLQADTGLDSYKFDAGETNWLPASATFFDHEDRLWPQIYTTAYVEACATFGGMIEVRAGFLNQDQPVFMRMLDRDSRWGYNNGLKSLIPAVFQIGFSGYPFVLPDMIGGNNYGNEEITQEFFVRWMQINALMPGVQFSLVPWNVGRSEAERAETVRLCLEVIAKREKYADHILRAARQAVEDGTPMNRPIFWVDPTDSETFAIDDEYMLGDSILVAPVVNEGQLSRDIYLPRGTWVAETDGAVHTGPVWLRNYPAPVNVVPMFVISN